MASINLIKASDGTGNASTATVQTVRNSGVTTIIVDTVNNIPATFMGSMGTPHTFVDPVTSEEITVISEATAVDFTGHVSGANLEIDSIAPGYTDLGSAVGDIIVIRPTTAWADNIATVLAVAHSDNGSHKAPTTYDGALSQIDNLTTSYQDGATLALPNTGVAHKYLISVSFIFNGEGGAATNYTGQVRKNDNTEIRTVLTSTLAGVYFVTVPLTTIYTAAAAGETIKFSALNGAGNGALSSYSRYTVVDLGIA